MAEYSRNHPTPAFSYGGRCSKSAFAKNADNQLFSYQSDRQYSTKAVLNFKSLSILVQQTLKVNYAIITPIGVPT